MTPTIAVIYHSRRGTIAELAAVIARAAHDAGAQVRLRWVADDAPVDSAVPAPTTAGPVAAPASLEDLVWADGLVLGTPTYYGNVSFPMKRFIDSTTELWRRGALADRIVAGFTSSTTLHGGREASLLALSHSLYHWGALIASTAASDPAFTPVGGNPFGLSMQAGRGGALSDLEQTAARTIGTRVTRLAWRLRDSRSDGGVARTPLPPANVLVAHGPGRGDAVAALATALAAGARAAGASVRNRRVPGHDDPVGSDSGTADPQGTDVAASLDDLEWADAIAFGAPARNGALASELLRFLETAADSGAADRLADAGVTAFTSTAADHSGSESALLSFYNVLRHHGAIIVPPGYTDPAVSAAGGNPYGTSYVGTSAGPPGAAVLAAARHQGHRLATTARLLAFRPDIALVPPAPSSAYG